MGIGVEVQFKISGGIWGPGKADRLHPRLALPALSHLVSLVRSAALNVTKIRRTVSYLIPSLSVQWAGGGGDGEQAYHCPY